MPYTQGQLSEFMHRQAGGMPELFGWTVEAGSYDDAVQDVLDAYGVTTLATATDSQQVRALARVAVWRQVVRRCASEYSTSVNGTSMSRSDLVKAAQEGLDLAMDEAGDLGYGPNVMTMDPVVYPNDPYTTLGIEERLR